MTNLDLKTLQWLMFECSPDNLGEAMDSFRRMQARFIRTGSDEEAGDAGVMLAESAIDLRSFLPYWWLAPGEYPGAVITEDELVGEMDRNLALLRQHTMVPLADEALGRIEGLQSSNLFRLARGAHNGEHNTHWGNDYASGLREAMRKGAILVTTNPVLIGIAAKENPGIWTPVRDRLIADNQSADAELIARMMTIRVVVENARLLRPIWHLSDRKLGYVSLQLSPKTAKDADAMIADALVIHEELKVYLGGEPNVVFKVPGTKAGITVARELTRRGIGVNITVSFALPQQIVFAGAIEQASTAPVSFRTQMDGRVDDPIGEDLRDNHPEVTDWAEVKQWATTIIRQREYGMLCLPPEQGGLGFTRSFCLGASGRGPWNIQRSICNGPAPLFLTVFPNRQEEFDAEPRELDPNAIWQPVPDDILEKLLKSRLFRMAYEPDGMNVDQFDTFLPVERTLEEFNTKYDAFVAWCDGADISVLN